MPRDAAKDEYGSQAPMAMMVSVVSVMGRDARLWIKGIRRVLIIWTIRVWVRSDSTNQPVWKSFAKASFCMKRQCRIDVGAALEEEPHQGEGGIVEDGAHRPDKHHKSLDIGDVPFQGPGDLLVIHIVHGDACLGEIVQEVIDEHLHRPHGQEGQQVACADDAEHVSEVGACTHADILDDVREDPSSFDDPLVKDKQALLQEHDVCGLLRDVDARVYRDADVRRLESRRIVDAVSHKADHVAVRAQVADNLLLLRR